MNKSLHSHPPTERKLKEKKSEEKEKRKLLQGTIYLTNFDPHNPVLYQDFLTGECLPS